jgi:hypothetical protein
MVSVWMHIYLHILAKFFNACIFFDFSFYMHILIMQSVELSYFELADECQQVLHQCNQHDKQWETFSSINWIHYFW